ncbi:tetratricopeptide repeat protein, partial [Haliea salexigens]
MSIEAAKACLQRGDFQAAEQAAAAAVTDGASSEALYLLATSRRYLGKHAQALATLEELERLDAGHARLYQERGHNLLALQQPAPALSAYRNAVARNPALLASWKAIARLTADNPSWQELAREAVIQAQALAQLPAEILSGQSMLHEGRLERAEALCRHYLRGNPQHIEGMRLLAAIAVQHGQLDEAGFLLESAAEFSPDNLLVRLDHVNVLYRQQRFTEALATAEALQQKLPGNLSIEATLANQYI